MGFLRRLVGGNPAGPDAEPGVPGGGGDAGATADEDEIARNRELVREEAERLNDELLQRQLRYADRSWIPPTQGGSQRSDDEGVPED
jgi:hypothetical protein